MGLQDLLDYPQEDTYKDDAVCGLCGVKITPSDEGGFPLCETCWENDPVDAWHPEKRYIIWDGNKVGHLRYRLVLEIAHSGYRYIWECPRQDKTVRDVWAGMHWLAWSTCHQQLEQKLIHKLNDPYTCFSCFGRTDSQGRCKCQY